MNNRSTLEEAEIYYAVSDFAEVCESLGVEQAMHELAKQLSEDDAIILRRHFK